MGKGLGSDPKTHVILTITVCKSSQLPVYDTLNILLLWPV